ncbi:ECF-type sigma factor [Sphingomonas sp. ERG5]|uniref:ECF-type sigma factor n=1 Tax=Sphingomonas sp. ERG5 TaxID=1381597 RepID=UPI000A5E5DB2|nr:ECF-type sigma factor [Sphingomonas sp. ERG5]
MRSSCRAGCGRFDQHIHGQGEGGAPSASPVRADGAKSREADRACHPPHAAPIKCALGFRLQARRERSIKPDAPSGDKAAVTSGDLVASLYAELHSIARREHFRAGGRQTLQTTALINEAYLKLHKRDGWESRTHFLGCAATAIRHILIDAARARLASKRDAPTYSFTQSLDSLAAAIPEDSEVVRLGDALKQLSELDPNLAQVVDCRFFAGLDERETAEVLGVSDRTVRRWWVQARALIYRDMVAD